MGVPYPVLTMLSHPPAHSPPPSCPCLGIRAFSARLHAEDWMLGVGSVGGPIMRT